MEVASTETKSVPCPVCGKKFVKKTARMSYCSSACRNAEKLKRRKKSRKPEQRTCRLCGKTFTVSRDRRKFCSPACAALFTEAKTREAHVASARRRAEQSGGVTVSRCKWCGKEFTRPRGSKLSYCSPECKREAKRESASACYMRRQAGIRVEKNAPSRTRSEAKGTYIQCEVCGTVFARKTSRHKYCSLECRWATDSVLRKQRYAALCESRVDPEPAADRTVKICPKCGKPVPEGANSAFCSHKCVLAYIEDLSGGTMDKNRRKCANCGMEYIYHLDSNSPVYCSPACSQEAERRRQNESIARYLATMTPEERAARQKALNEKARNTRKAMKEALYDDIFARR